MDANTATSYQIDFESFQRRCVKLCINHLSRDANGIPVFDGSIAGCDTDWLFDQWKAHKRPLDVLHTFLWRKRGLHMTESEYLEWLSCP